MNYNFLWYKSRINFDFQYLYSSTHDKRFKKFSGKNSYSHNINGLRITENNINYVLLIIVYHDLRYTTTNMQLNLLVSQSWLQSFWLGMFCVWISYHTITPNTFKIWDLVFRAIRISFTLNWLYLSTRNHGKTCKTYIDHSIKFELCIKR